MKWTDNSTIRSDRRQCRTKHPQHRGYHSISLSHLCSNFMPQQLCAKFSAKTQFHTKSNSDASRLLMIVSSRKANMIVLSRSMSWRGSSSFHEVLWNGHSRLVRSCQDGEGSIRLVMNNVNNIFSIGFNETLKKHTCQQRETEDCGTS
jgi:hypothetical protein